MKIIWEKKALQDIDRIKTFLLNDLQLDEDVIGFLISLIWNAPNKLLAMPRMGSQLEFYSYEEVRRIFVRNYEIRYQLLNNTIFILRVMHMKEDREG